MDILNRILELGNMHNMTANKIAVECKLSSSKMTQWKNGRQKPSLDALIKIADYFNVSLDYLVGRNNFDKSLQVSTKNIIISNSLQSKIETLDDRQLTALEVFIDTLKGTDIRAKNKSNTS
jgi:transcriptional regulator with XRE-family HTH domain